MSSPPDIVSSCVVALTTVAAWVVDKAPMAYARAIEHASSLCDSTVRGCERAWEKARYAWALAVATYRVSVLQRLMASHELLMYKIVALNEQDGTDAIVTKSFESERWEESTRAATGWLNEKMRVEVRYLAHGKKYRAVLRPGDECAFQAVPERHRGGPKGVMAAELVGNDVTVNITRRVHKYEGPMKDFHRRMGLRVSVSDMFPFDDTEELTHAFHTLRIVDAHARVLHLPLTTSDLAAALANEGKTD